MGPVYMASSAKQAAKLDIRNMMSARRRSKRPTAFHRLAALLSVPLSVRVLVFGVVVVVASVPAPTCKHAHMYAWNACPTTVATPILSSATFGVPIGSLFAVPTSTSTAILDTFDLLLLLFLSLSSSSTLLSADVDVRDEDAGREQIDGEKLATLE